MDVPAGLPPLANPTVPANATRFTEIVARERTRLGRFIRGQVRDAADAEDILQDVLLEFYAATEAIEQVGAWLFRVARNRVIDRRRLQALSCECYAETKSVFSHHHHARTYWDFRHLPNLLFVHYNDLKADLSGEMKRIAAFLGIETPAALWPELVEAATFDKMKTDGAALLPGIEMAFRGGHQTFLNKGINGRWKGVLSEADVKAYRERAAAELPPGLNAWLENGRAVAGEPKSSSD